MSNNQLLGGTCSTPATEEEKTEFKRLLGVSNPTAEELRNMQRIEWGLTKEEYLSLKFPTSSERQ